MVREQALECDYSSFDKMRRWEDCSTFQSKARPAAMLSTLRIE